MRHAFIVCGCALGALSTLAHAAPGDHCGTPIVVNLPARAAFVDANTTCGRADDLQRNLPRLER